VIVSVAGCGNAATRPARARSAPSSRWRSTRSCPSLRYATREGQPHAPRGSSTGGGFGGGSGGGRRVRGGSGGGAPADDPLGTTAVPVRCRFVLVRADLLIWLRASLARCARIACVASAGSYEPPLLTSLSRQLLWRFESWLSHRSASRRRSRTPLAQAKIEYVDYKDNRPCCASSSLTAARSAPAG